jgi:uncharacterized membrane protein YgaE (UPF0421/DUF939 family)
LTNGVWLKDSLIALFERIPPTFLGIIIGSLFTIIGVVLTNASNR